LSCAQTNSASSRRPTSGGGFAFGDSYLSHWNVMFLLYIVQRNKKLLDFVATLPHIEAIIVQRTINRLPPKPS
jgi:hypothetical protein